MKKRVVVTGIGFVSPLGSDEETLAKNLYEGKLGISEISLYSDPNLKIKFAAECRDFDSSKYFTFKEGKRLDRVNQFGVVAARKALEDSKLEVDYYDEDRFSVIVGSGIGGLGTIEEESQKVYEKDFTKISPFFIPKVIANMTSAHIAIDLKIHGNVSCPVTACASSSTAIMDGYRLIKDGYCDCALVGGAEASITRLGIGGFASMKALAEVEDITRASIPFDKERSGFVMGEGGAVLVLEEYENAKKRNAKIYGEIVGASMTCDGNHITAPDPTGKYAAMAIKNAIKESGFGFDKVDYINAHGTSTPLNDKTEIAAIKKDFGQRAKDISISSTKSMTGHLLGAAGALELIISLLAIKKSFIPPTINYKEYDEDCDLNISPNQSYNKKIRLALSNSLGFGGHNVAILVRGTEDDL